jgi:5-methylcytosine-specific restriction endonuclease McrA
LRFEILKRDRVCQLCGVGRNDAVLEVDHIVPRSKGGSNDPDNLQVLCARCNRGKSNRDDTDFR